MFGLFSKKKTKVYNNTFSNPVLNGNAKNGGHPKNDSILFLDDFYPAWIRAGELVPETPPAREYNKAALPAIPHAIRQKVGKALEGRFQLSLGALNLLSVLNDPNSNAAQQTEAASKDPKLAAKILKTVNSAGFGLAQEITAVGRGIVMLGLNNIRALAMADAVSSMGSGPAAAWQRRLWMHSAMTSACAYALARKSHKIEPGDAATVGLLINMGKVLFKPEEVVKLCQATKLSSSIVEGYGAACFAETWGLPKMVGAALEHISVPFHYDLDAVPAELRHLVAMVAFSSFVARWYGFGDGGDLGLPHPKVFEMLGWSVAPEGTWVTGDIALEMEKARISMDIFLS